MHASAEPYLALLLRLCAAGVLIQTLELLWHRHELQDGRLLGRNGEAPAQTTLGRWAGALVGYRGCVSALTARALLAGACLGIGYATTTAFVLIGLLVLAQIFYNRRFVTLAGNCDTIFLVCLVAAWAGALPGSDGGLGKSALIFAACHASLAYFAAGLHKLRSGLWRSGWRLHQIAKYGSYRLPAFALGALARPRTARWTSRAVIALELALGLTVLLPPAIAWPLLVAGFAFHTLVAVTMGLHGFWWAFAAAYPAMVYVNRLMHHNGAWTLGP